MRNEKQKEADNWLESQTEIAVSRMLPQRKVSPHVARVYGGKCRDAVIDEIKKHYDHEGTDCPDRTDFHMTCVEAILDALGVNVVHTGQGG